MKKGKILRTLAIAGTCLCAPLLLSGCTTGNENKTDFRVYDGYIQVTKDGKTWENLVDLDDIKGHDGIGIDGKQVQFQVTQTHVQWRYVGESDSDWKDLIELEDLKGDDLSFENYTVEYDYGASEDLFVDSKLTDSIKSTEWLVGLPEIKADYQDSFIGWFIKDTNKQIENYDFIGGNVTLEARFDIEKLGLSGLYQNGKYALSWSDLKDMFPYTISATSMNYSYGERTSFEKLQGDLIIDSSITNINQNAFQFCGDLKVIVLPNNLKVIEDGAFQVCKSLEGLTIPASVTSIGVRVFDNCSNLLYLAVDENNAKFDSRDKCNAIIEKNTNTLLYGCGSTTIPSGVVKINPYAIYGNSLIENVVVPEGVSWIDDGFLSLCYSLKSISIPASVSHISSIALNDCINLQHIVVDEENEIYDSRNNCNALIETSSNKLLIGCGNTIIPNGVAIIANGAFKGSETLTSINIPNTVIEIEDFAFSDCNKLNSIWIPSSVEKMGLHVFGRRLTQNYQSNYLLFVACEDVEKPELWNDRWAEYVEDDGTIVWNAKEQKKSEDFIYSVTNDNKVVIQRCISNKNAFVLTKLDELDIVEIDNCAFYDKDNLQEINLEDTAIEIISKYSFYGCDNLTSIKLPSTLKTIEDTVFYNCTKLNYIFIGANSCLERVGSYNSNSFSTVCCKDEYNENLDAVLPFSNVIYNFKELKQDDNYIYAILNDNTIHIINYIGDSEFVLIDTIEEKNVAEIGYYAFKDCNTLRTIYIKNDIIFTNHNNPYCLLQYFTKQITSDKTGYDMYVRNAE